jgi:hypothetical protein
VEDWYYVNVMLLLFPLSHPVHMHLINFQIQSYYDLTLRSQVTNATTMTCAYLTLDFLGIDENDDDACLQSHPLNFDKYINSFN